MLWLLFGGVALALSPILAGLTAGFAKAAAHRTIRVDPLEALRYE